MTHATFMYGSNLDPQRLHARAPAWDGTYRIAKLPQYELRFHKRSERYRVAANVVPHQTRCVWGILVYLCDRDLARMDSCEGCYREPPHYRRLSATVHLSDRLIDCHLIDCHLLEKEQRSAYLYIASSVWHVEGLQPTIDYMAHVISGAVWCGLPSAYINAIAQLGLPSSVRSHRSPDS
ncbi:MAG: gamma-glutamylcyclotransferase family protein [Cyanobacteria bacterium J06642_2]